MTPADPRPDTPQSAARAVDILKLTEGRGHVAQEGAHERLMARPDGVCRSMFTARAARAARAAQYSATAPDIPQRPGHGPVPNPAEGGPR